MPEIFELSTEEISLSPAINTSRFSFNAFRLPDCPNPITNKMILRSGVRHDEAWLLVDEVIGEEVKTETNVYKIKVGENLTDGWYCVKRWKVFAGQTPFYYLKFVDRRGLELDSPVSTDLDIQDLIDNNPTGSLQKVIDKIFELHFGTSGAITAPTPTNDEPTVVSIFDKTVGQILQIMCDHYPAVILRDPETNTYSLSDLTTETTEDETKFIATHENSLLPNAKIKSCRVSDSQSEGESFSLEADGKSVFHVIIDNLNDSLDYTTVGDAVDYMCNREGKLLILPTYFDRKPSATFDTITFRDQLTIIETAVIPRCNYEPAGSSGGGTTICLASANADFDTTDASVSVTIRQSLQGSASGTVTAYNELQTYGTAGVYAWAGAEDTQMWIIKSEEKSGLIDQWRILNIVPTDCDCPDV